MRLWSIHPGYLDAKGLVALWREGLLAQKVLSGTTRGYTNHPQLIRFKRTEDPVSAIAGYLEYVVDEADSRGYRFNRSKILNIQAGIRMPVTGGQLEYEFSHLLGKVQERDPAVYKRLRRIKKIIPHPVFTRVIGPVEEWEILKTRYGFTLNKER